MSEENYKFYIKNDDSIGQVREVLTEFIKQKTIMDRIVCENESLKEWTIKMMEYVIDDILTLEEWEEVKKFQKMCLETPIKRKKDD